MQRSFEREQDGHGHRSRHRHERLAKHGVGTDDEGQYGSHDTCDAEIALGRGLDPGK